MKKTVICLYGCLVNRHCTADVLFFTFISSVRAYKAR